MSAEEPDPGALPPLVVSTSLSEPFARAPFTLSIVLHVCASHPLWCSSVSLLSHIFYLSSFSQTLKQCKLRKTLKLWHHKYLMLKTIGQSSKHLHRAVCEEPLAMLFSEDLSASSGFDSSAPATLTSQSSLEKVRRSWYAQTALRH